MEKVRRKLVEQKKRKVTVAIEIQRVFVTQNIDSFTLKTSFEFRLIE